MTGRPRQISDRTATLVGLGALTAGGLLLAACRAPGERPADGVPQRVMPGEPLPYDPARAFLTLDEVQPKPEAPRTVAEWPPVPEPVGRAIEAARTLQTEGKHAEAAAELERLLAAEPSSPDLHRALARIYVNSGELERARGHARRALELRSDDGAAHYVLAGAAVADRNPTEAIRHCRVALQCPDVASDLGWLALVHYRLALCLEGEGYLTAAIGEYSAFENQARLLGDAPPDDPELTTLLHVTGRSAAGPIAAIHERLGRYADAAEALRRILDEQPSADAQVRARYARMLARAGRCSEALVEARKLEPDAHLLVEILELAGESERITEELRALHQENPNDLPLLEALVDRLVADGRTAEAEHVLREQVDRAPDDPAPAWALFDFLIGQRRWSIAVDEAAALLDRHPDEFATARGKMAKVARRSQAVASLLDAALPGPEGTINASRAYLLGCAAAASGRGEAAERWFVRALDLAPTSVGPRVGLAMHYLDRYQWADAIEVAQLGVAEAAGQAQLEQILGKAYAGLDDVGRAVSHYSEAVRLNRSDTRSMLALAALFERTDQADRAKEQYEAILQESPLDTGAREALAMLHLNIGDRSAAAEQIAEMKRLAAPAQSVARCVARIELDPRDADYTKFRRTLLEAVGEEMPEAQTALLVASSYVAERDLDAAWRYVELGLSVGPEDEELLDLKIWLCRQRLDFDQAEHSLRELVGRYPNRVRWLNHLLDVLRIRQDDDALIALLESMLDRDGFPDRESHRYRGELVQAIASAGNPEAAVDLTSKWCREQPHDASSRALRVRALLLADRDAEALAAMQAWYDESGGDRERDDLIAVLTRTGRHDRASQLVLAALEKSPADPELQLALIATLTGAKRFDDAVEIAQANYVRPETRDQFEFAAYQVYAAAGRHDEAIRLIEQWIHRTERGLVAEFAIESPRLHELLVGQLLLAGRLEDARNRLTRWLEAEDNPAARLAYLLLLSECDRLRGRMDQSVEAMELAYEINPLDVNLCNSLGYSWADEGTNLDQAEQLIRYAVAQEPTNYAYLDSLGWVLYKEGDFEAARKWLELARGADQEDRDPVIHDHLGDTYWRMGDTDRAMTSWRTAVESAHRATRDVEDPSQEEAIERTRAKLDAASHGREPVTAPTGSETSEADGFHPAGSAPAESRKPRGL